MLLMCSLGVLLFLLTLLSYLSNLPLLPLPSYPPDLSHCFEPSISLNLPLVVSDSHRASIYLEVWNQIRSSWLSISEFLSEIFKLSVKLQGMYKGKIYHQVTDYQKFSIDNYYCLNRWS